MASKKTPPWKLYELENVSLTADQVFIQLGVMVFLLHRFEQNMSLCTAFLQTAAFSNTDDVIERFWRMKKSTCGGLATELRKFVQIERGFDQALSRLIRRRNAFAHKLSVYTPFNPSSGTAWLRNVPRFLWALHADLIQVEDVFLSYLQGIVDRHEGNPLKRLPGPAPYPLLGFKTAQKTDGKTRIS